MLNRSLVSRLSLSAALAALGACSSAPTHFYTLQPVASANPGHAVYNGPALEVNIVHIPPELDRNELMREVAPGQFEVRELDQWIAPFGRLVRQTVSEDLALRLPAGSLIYPNAHAPAGSASLSINILSYRVEGNKQTMQVSWSLQDARLVTPTHCGGQLELQTSVSHPDGTGTPVALSALMGDLADSIAGQLAEGCISKFSVVSD
jgi:uncharacterized lipoprotein YmbA